MLMGRRNPVGGNKGSAFLLVAFVACATVLFHPAPSRSYDLSLEDEKIVGENFLKDVRKHFEIVDDDFLNAYINDLGQYLTKSLEIKPFPFHFYIINKLFNFFLTYWSFLASSYNSF